MISTNYTAIVRASCREHQRSEVSSFRVDEDHIKLGCGHHPKWLGKWFTNHLTGNIFWLPVDTPAISVTTPVILVDTPGVSVNTPKMINPIYPATQRPESSESEVVSPHPRHLRPRPTLTHLRGPTLHTYETLPYTPTRPYLTRLRGPTLHTYEAPALHILGGLLTGQLGGLLGRLLEGLLGRLLEGLLGRLLGRLCQILRSSAYCARLVSIGKHVESESLCRMTFLNNFLEGFRIW